MRSALLEGISDELKQLMVTQITPEDLDELVTLLQRLDTRQRNVNASPPEAVKYIRVKRHNQGIG